MGSPGPSGRKASVLSNGGSRKDGGGELMGLVRNRREHSRVMPRFGVWMTGVTLAQLVELEKFEVGGSLRRKMKIWLGLERA